MNLKPPAQISSAPVLVSPIQAGDHFVLRRLSSQLLPWMICGRRLRRLPIVRLAIFWEYTGDLAAALAGLGIGTPMVALFSGKAPEGRPALDVLREVLPGWWVFVGVAALIAWLILRLVVQKEDIVVRARLARDCAESMKALRQQLWIALSEPDPMPKIILIQKSVEDHVQNAIKNKVWPWEPLPPPEEIAPELRAIIDDIRTNFMHIWAAHLVTLS